MTPKVSIGPPVYNGEDYLPGAIQSVLAQDFDDYELVTSDEYYCRLASDDMWTPDFLSGCVAVLDSGASVVVCCSNVTFFDDGDHLVDDLTFDVPTWSDRVIAYTTS